MSTSLTPTEFAESILKLMKKIPPAPVKFELNALALARVESLKSPQGHAQSAPMSMLSIHFGTPYVHDPLLDCNLIPVCVITFSDGTKKNVAFVKEGGR